MFVVAACAAVQGAALQLAIGEVRTRTPLQSAIVLTVRKQAPTGILSAAAEAQ